MFASLFSSKSSDSARDISASEAMAALMVRIAKSDDEYSTAEIARIDAVLGLLYKLTADQAANLRQTAEALEAGLEAFAGTVICVTHDRWFLKGFDRFIAFTEDHEVIEIDDPSMAWTQRR